MQTAVAIFGPDRRLNSYNAAYRALFGLDPAFLESAPEEIAMLERLRAARKLPEQADFRSWRNDLLAAYQTIETREQWWHLPDGQTLRVIANPHPQGGITWIYENVTERLDLESRYNALVSVQGETLDHLAEGVAVFGSDGRLRLHNPAFAAIWSLDADAARRPAARLRHRRRLPAAGRRRGHVAALHRLRRRPRREPRARSPAAWSAPTAASIDYATVPLPDGQTMVTFVDVTDSVQVERALVERNEALEAADALKNAFIHHVSYELRSPLTNIIGFAQLLSDEQIGPLNEKQREYTGYIMSSSAALLAIVNDILDLATIDAGIMGLDLGRGRRRARPSPRRSRRSTTASPKPRIRSRPTSPPTSAPSSPTRSASARSSSISSPTPSASRARGRLGDGVGRARRRHDRVHGRRRRRRHPARFHRLRLRPLRQPAARLGARRRRPRPVDRQELRRLHGGTVEIDSEEGKGTTVKVRLPMRPALDVAVPR